jgi:hypothetical protein
VAKFRFVASALLGLLAGTPSFADTISFQEGALLPGGGTYASTQDTEIQGAAPTTNLGSEPSLRADADQLGFPAQSLVRFDDIFGAALGQIPLGSTIISAILAFEVENASSAPAGNISVFQMTVGWAESSTWDSLGSGVTTGSETVASPDDTVTATALGPVSFDVLTSVQAWAAGASNFGWVLTNDSTDGLQLRSSEFGTLAVRPSLTIEYTPIPEPGTAQLVGLAGVAALVARRLRR